MKFSGTVSKWASKQMLKFWWRSGQGSGSGSGFIFRHW